MTLNTLPHLDGALVASLAETTAESLGIDRHRTITTHKPLYPPARIMRNVCEGIEPLHMTPYVRRIPSGSVEPK